MVYKATVSIGFVSGDFDEHIIGTYDTFEKATTALDQMKKNMFQGEDAYIGLSDDYYVNWRHVENLFFRVDKVYEA